MRLIITLTGLLLLAACGPDVTKTERANNPEANITRLLDAQEYQMAADEALKLTRLYPEKSTHYQQRAIEIYLQSGDLYAAKAVLKDLPVDNDNNRFLSRVLDAKIALQGNDPAKAVAQLQANPLPGAPETLLRSYYQTKSLVYERQRNFIEAVRNRLNLARLLKTPGEIEDNTASIWTTLNKLNPTALRQLRATTPDLSSWLDLALIYQTMLFQAEALRSAVSMWQQQYPDHPANETIIRQILTAANRDNFQPRHIALCLPFSGQLGTVSQAIREGFLAAWYSTPAAKPVIDIFDGDATNINTVYATAIANGADLVIGPLEKNAIIQLLANNSLKVTTLALNQIDTPLRESATADPGSSMPKLIQFGLSPEDEAREVAIRARLDGHKRALVITPDNDRGQRLFEAFRTQWLSSGGNIMEQVKYPDNTEEYKTWVKSLMNANTSDKRAADLRTRLNRNIRSETRLRTDADVIFMAASPVAARRIVPEFRFYESHVPIYATSDIYAGIHNPQQDKDLDDVTFNHMPWVLDPVLQTAPLQQTINNHWSAQTSSFRHFYALGIDTYQLIAHLPRMAMLQSVTYPGTTGVLSLAKDGHIQRKLLWAKFSQGEPVLLDQTF